VEEICDMWINLLVSISELFFHVVIFVSNQKQIEGRFKMDQDRQIRCANLWNLELQFNLDFACVSLRSVLDLFFIKNKKSKGR
jgi:hypothetical protein